MLVNVHLFALLRDRAGVGQLKLPLPEGSTVESAVQRLMRQYPSMEGAVGKICYAVNRDYANAQTRLYDGDDLALIPPVSGG